MRRRMAENKALLPRQQQPTDAQVLEAKKIDLEEDDGPAEALSSSSWWQRVGSATFYCVGSFVITLSNKAVLTSYGFPSSEVLGLAQLVTTVVCLLAAHLSGGIRIPMLTMDVFVQVWPLPGIFLGNLLFGLGGMRFLSLPIFISLRRFTIAMTMLAEVFILGVVPRTSVVFSVGLMTAGAVLAAANDLNVTLIGVVYVLLNDVCSAAQGVYVKRCLPHLGPYGVLFYNALLSMAPMAMVVLIVGGADQTLGFPLWSEWRFALLFGVSCAMGAVLQYSMVLCVQHNTALTASIMGSVKNVSVTYVGMFVGGDYLFTVLNFVGVNISVMGTLVYLWLTFVFNKE